MSFNKLHVSKTPHCNFFCKQQQNENEWWKDKDWYTNRFVPTVMVAILFEKNPTNGGKILYSDRVWFMATLSLSLVRLEFHGRSEKKRQNSFQHIFLGGSSEIDSREVIYFSGVSKKENKSYNCLSMENHMLPCFSPLSKKFQQQFYSPRNLIGTMRETMIFSKSSPWKNGKATRSVCAVVPWQIGHPFKWTDMLVGPDYNKKKGNLFENKIIYEIYVCLLLGIAAFWCPSVTSIEYFCVNFKLPF